MKKILLLITILSLFLIQCGNFITSSANNNNNNNNDYTFLKDRKGRYSIETAVNQTMDIVLFDTGYIQIIMKTTAGNVNSGSYYLGNPGNAASQYDFTINVNNMPVTYTMDFQNNTLITSGVSIPMTKVSSSTDIQLDERVGMYLNWKNQKQYVIVSKNSIALSIGGNNTRIENLSSTSKEISYSKEIKLSGIEGIIEYTFVDKGVRVVYKVTDSQLGTVMDLDEVFTILDMQQNNL
ncbi:hypothetical protein R4K55_06260 [Brachyspira alvinipulli]|uniref:hypothetical protein n=1 Tax=Brachyspira alvinipulli TaxID=84379 RepID=UPI003005AF03